MTAQRKSSYASTTAMTDKQIIAAVMREVERRMKRAAEMTGYDSPDIRALLREWCRVAAMETLAHCRIKDGNGRVT